MARILAVLLFFIVHSVFGADPFLINLTEGFQKFGGKKQQQFKVYSKPDKNSKPNGTIYVSRNKYSGKAEIIYGRESLSDLIFNDYCGENLFALLLASEEKNDFFKIGHGYFSLGWIKAKGFRITAPEKDRPVKLSFEDHMATFEKGEGDKVWAILKATSSYEEDKRKEVDFYNISENGRRLEVKPYCDAETELKNIKEKPSIPKDFKEQIIVNFSDSQTEDNPQESSCWNPDLRFNDRQCEMESKTCEVETIIPNAPVVDLMIFPSEEIKNRKLNLYIFSRGLHEKSTKVETSNSSPWKSLKKIPVGAELFLYEIDEHKNLYVYWKGKVPVNGELRINKISTGYKKVRLAIDWAKNNLVANVSLFGNHIGTIDKNDMILRLPEGEYTFSFQKLGEEGEIYQKIVRDIVVSKPTNEIGVDQQTINILAYYRDLEKKSSKKDNKNYSLSWATLGENSSLLLNSDDKSEKMAITNLDALEIKEDGRELKNIFELKKGSLVLKDKTAFTSIKKDFPIYYTIKMKGRCGEYSYFKSYKSLTVFSSPSESSKKLGTLDIRYQKNDFFGKFRAYDDHSKDGIFKLNMDAGSCLSSFYLLHHAKAAEGSYVNLGEGPWGSEGWIHHIYYRLFKDAPFMFEWLSDRNWVQFRVDDNNKLFAEGSNAIAPDSEGIINEDLKIPVDFKDLFDEEGKLRLNLNCSYGC